MSRYSVTIVTPWLDHLELAPDYFQAMHAVTAADEVLVIDNASDPPLKFARPEFRLTENQGYAGASNRGLEAATTDAVLFLNNDIQATRPDWLEQLVAHLEPGVLVGARLRHDAHGSVDGHPFPYLDGWCLAGMRDDLLSLGGFDEEYEEPAYYSDNDLCLRARAAGMSLREVRVGLRHLVGMTAGENTNPEIVRVTAANKERFEERAREILGAVAA